MRETIPYENLKNPSEIRSVLERIDLAVEAGMKRYAAVSQMGLERHHYYRLKSRLAALEQKGATANVRNAATPPMSLQETTEATAHSTASATPSATAPHEGNK